MASRTFILGTLQNVSLRNAAKSSHTYFLSRFEMETSLWGPFLSAVNGEQARQSDRRYWHLSSDHVALNEGAGTLKHTPNNPICSFLTIF